MDLSRDGTASSTVLDTLLFVLLVGAAVGVLAGSETFAVGGGGGAGNGLETDRMADILATSTAEVTHVRTATVTTASLLDGEDSRQVRVERTSRGTYAELLAAAATADPELSDAALTGRDGNLARQTRAVTERVLSGTATDVHVRAVWRPYPDAPLAGAVAAGEQPPANADISATRMAVPSGFDCVRADARSAARTDSYAGVATVVARAVVDGLSPPAETGEALYSEGPDRALVADRYRTAMSALGVDWDGRLGPRDVSSANDRLADALASRLRADMASRYDSPAAAADAVRVGEVRLVVRAWSA